MKCFGKHFVLFRCTTVDRIRRPTGKAYNFMKITSKLHKRKQWEGCI